MEILVLEQHIDQREVADIVSSFDLCAREMTTALFQGCPLAIIDGQEGCTKNSELNGRQLRSFVLVFFQISRAECCRRLSAPLYQFLL